MLWLKLIHDNKKWQQIICVNTDPGHWLPCLHQVITLISINSSPCLYKTHVSGIFFSNALDPANYKVLFESHFLKRESRMNCGERRVISDKIVKPPFQRHSCIAISLSKGSLFLRITPYPPDLDLPANTNFEKIFLTKSLWFLSEFS